MRNLLIFISKYNAFFLFLIFEVTSIIIYIKYNSFQKATFLSTSNRIVGSLFSKEADMYGYLSLKQVNDSLAKENTRLRNQLKTSFYVDTIARRKVNDTVYKQQYEYIIAKVINNSVNRRNNYLTINRGTREGIAKGMGVISNSGVVGIVVATTEHFASVRSLLHKDSKFSAMLASSKDVGSLVWGDDLNPRKALLIDIQNNAQPKIGEQVVTSSYSLFPTGTPIGKISSLHVKGGGFFLNLEVDLAVDFSKLEYVYVINNKFAAEQTGLEAQQKKDE